MCFSFSHLLSLVSPCHLVAGQSCKEWISIKKYIKYTDSVKLINLGKQINYKSIKHSLAKCWTWIWLYNLFNCNLTLYKENLCDTVLKLSKFSVKKQRNNGPRVLTLKISGKTTYETRNMKYINWVLKENVQRKILLV